MNDYSTLDSTHKAAALTQMEDHDERSKSSNASRIVLDSHTLSAIQWQPSAKADRKPIEAAEATFRLGDIENCCIIDAR